MKQTPCASNSHRCSSSSRPATRPRRPPETRARAAGPHRYTPNTRSVHQNACSQPVFWHLSAQSAAELGSDYGSVSLVAQNGLSSSAARAATGVVSKSPVAIGTSLSVARTMLENPFPLASVATPAEDRTTAAMICRPIDSCFCSSGCSLAREGKPASAARLRRPAGGVLNADHVRPGDDSIDVADLVGENQLDVGRALDVGYIVRSARLAREPYRQMFGRHARYGGGCRLTSRPPREPHQGPKRHQCWSPPVAAGGRDSSASDVIASGPRAAASSTSVASSPERA